VISKHVAGREKDRIFTGELARRGIVSRARLLALLARTPITETERARIHDQIALDFQVRP